MQIEWKSQENPPFFLNNNKLRKMLTISDSFIGESVVMFVRESQKKHNAASKWWEDNNKFSSSNNNLLYKNELGEFMGCWILKTMRKKKKSLVFSRRYSSRFQTQSSMRRSIRTSQRSADSGIDPYYDGGMGHAYSDMDCR